MSTKLTVVTILQYVHISNYCVVQLGQYNVICQLYINKTEKKTHNRMDKSMV